MLAYSIANFVYNALLPHREEEVPDSVIENEEELDNIIDAIAEAPPRRELDRFANAPILSQNEALVCEDRLGFVTGLSANTGMIDNKYIFHLDNNEIAAELLIGSKVSYTAYRLAANEEWRVRNINLVHEENWEPEPEVQEDDSVADHSVPDRSVADDSFADKSVADSWTPSSEVVKVSGVQHRVDLLKVDRREGRIAIMDNHLRVDLNLVHANFTPLAGDFVSVDVLVKTSDESYNLAGEVIEILGLRPLRTRKREESVTVYNPKTGTGTLGADTFFKREFCSPGYVPTKGDKVVVVSLESWHGGLQWRALRVEPKTVFEKPTVPEEERARGEFDDQQIFKDKNSVFVTRSLDFGTVEMGERRVLEFAIDNSGTQPVRVESIKLVRTLSGQLTLCNVPVVPRSLGPGAIMKMSISCCARMPGHHEEIVVVEFDGFKIARKIFCEVTSAKLQRMALAIEGQRRQNRYDYSANRAEAMKRQKLRMNSDTRSIPGVPLSKAPAFVAFRLPLYPVPDSLYDLIDCPRSEVVERIYDRFPFFRQGLIPGTYTRHFVHLLFLAEVDAVLELRKYDMMRVKFERKGEYLSLSVPGLAESRPSLLTGDRIEAKSPYVESEPFTGVIHKTLKAEVLLKFDPAFHSKYSGEDYRVSFLVSRGSWRRSHHGIQKAMQALGTSVLFPTHVLERPPLIPFEEVEGPAPHIQPTSAPSFSEETLTPKEQEASSSSSDEGNLRNPQPKENCGPNLTMDKEKKRPKETSDCEGSSPAVSGGEPTIPRRSLSGLIETLKTSTRSDSETSDKERSGIETKKAVRSSPREGLQRFLREYASAGRSPILNGSQTPTSCVSPTIGSPTTAASSASPTVGTPTTAASSASPTVGTPTTAASSASPTVGTPTTAASSASPTVGTPTTAARSAGRIGVSPSTAASSGSPRTGTATSGSLPEGVSPKLPKLHWINTGLNPRQKDAVRNVLRGEARPLPYIIFGPPGTGKTITLVEAILQIYLLMPQSRILITTPSNSSANLIAERLLDARILKPGEMVRLLARHAVEKCSVPPRLLPYCALIDINAQARDSPEVTDNIPQISAKAIGRHRISVATCSTSGQLFYLKLPADHFSHIVIDEAGQATEPDTMVTLAFLNRANGQAILAGDPLQLGPVVPSKIASELGLGISFLDRLLQRFPYNRDTEGFPETGGYDPRLVTRLVYNYRSVPSILQICSEMFYDSELIATLDGETSEEALILPPIADALKIPRFGVVFEGVRGDDNQAADDPSWFNLHEVIAVLKYVAELSKLEISGDDIGIITPYRKQVMRLRSAFEDNAVIKTIPKIGTVEEFQGQEKLIIIVSTVRSSNRVVKADQKHHLGFVASPRRLNVAISRARSLLIVVGNPHLLCYDAYWKTFFKYCCRNGSYIGCNPPPSVFDNCLQ